MIARYRDRGGTALSNASGTLPPAGWYPDPYGAPFERWWDGAQWTLHTTEGQPPADSSAAGAGAAAATTEQQAETSPAASAQPTEQSWQPQPTEQSWQPQQAETSPAASAQPAEQPQQTEQSWQPEGPQSWEAPAAQQPEQTSYTPPALQYPDPTPAQPSPDTYNLADAFTEPSEQRPVFGGTPQPEDPFAFGGSQAAADSLPTSNPFPAATPYPASDSTASGAVGQNPGAGATAAESDPFDFGFGAPAAASTPSAGPVFPAPSEGDSGLFGSWEPEEYEQSATNGPATASLTLGILSFFLSGLTGVIGIILGVVGLSKAARLDREGEGPVGRGKAIGGIVTSVIGSAVAAALIIYALPLILPGQDDATDGADGGSDLVDTTALTVNGGIPLDIGTAGAINFPDTENPAVQFTVTDITRDPTCSADPTEVLSPENGQFVAVTMTFVLDPEYLSIMTSGAPMRVSTDSWIGFLPDSAQVNSTDAGNSCNTAEQQIPELTPGSTVSGTIVLDLTAETTAISWSPSDVNNLEPGITRWEWNIPAS